MTNFTEQMQAFSVQMEEMKKEMTAKIKGLMQPAFKEFFDRHPDVKYVSWTQYTPHFNDGEPCEFGVHEKSLAFRDDAADFDAYDTDDDGKMVWYSFDELPKPSRRAWYEEQLAKYADSSPSNAKYYKEALAELDNPDLEKIFAALNDLQSFNSIPEEVYQTLGEGRVFVTPSGIDVQDYDHD